MDEERLKMDVRLYCAEWLASSTLALLLKASGNADELFAAIRTQALDGAKKKAFPSADPAMSDLLSGELETAMDRLLGMTGYFLGKNSAT